MACECKTWFFLPLLLLALNYIQQLHGEPQVPCLFIFGDSISDSGNNNNLKTSAKANYKPYGIDFPTGPSGRFTNGRTEIDFISQFLGFEDFIPPFGNTGGSDILRGVNYASGASGIRVESGSHLGGVLNIDLQIANHRVIVSRIASILGGLNKARNYLSKCLYYVNIGSNDYMNNYFLPQFYPTSRFYSPEQFAELLIDELSLNLQELYDVGARKFGLAGLGLLGCTPGAVNTHGASTGSTCFDEENAAAIIFNNKLGSLVDLYNRKLSPYAKFVFINTTASAIANSDGKKGFTVTTIPCCPTGPGGACIAEERTCYNRGEYVFWDDHHTTEAWNLLNAKYAYYGNAAGQPFTHPMPIKHLVAHELQMEPNGFTSQFSASI